MPELQVLTQRTDGDDGVCEIAAEVDDGRVVTGPDGVETALGWSVRPEGLCRGDVCVPVRDRDAIAVGDRFDLDAVADALGIATLLDEETGVLALSAPAGERQSALRGRRAPDFSLPDLDGRRHSLEQFAGRKRLLIAFASW
jgi:hypothetical protein